MGLFGQASKLVSSVFGGGSKKAKPEVKSLQLAAAAAKKVRVILLCWESGVLM